MQPDIMTLQVDTNNDGTPTATPYTRYEETQNRTVYIADDHTPAVRNQVAFYRSLPTKSGNFRGVGKSSVKFTRDTQVPGVDLNTTLASSIIVDVSFSVPVGLDAIDVRKMRQSVIALLDNDTIMNALNIQLMV